MRKQVFRKPDAHDYDFLDLTENDLLTEFQMEFHGELVDVMGVIEKNRIVFIFCTQDGEPYEIYNVFTHESEKMACNLAMEFARENFIDGISFLYMQKTRAFEINQW